MKPSARACSAAPAAGLALLLALSAAGTAAAPEPAQPKPPPPASTTDELFEAGRSLFEQLVPEDVRENLRFPTREEWEGFAARLQSALEDSNLDALAEYEPQVRAALAALPALPGTEDYLDWLQERLDYIEGAKQTRRPPPPPPPGKVVPIPHYGLWLARMKSRPVPPRAAALLPRVRAEFTAAGLPAELAWVAEVESSFNPNARSPVGARGLYQLMPATARELGLSTTLPDERTDPAKNARAAARYLRQLHGQFKDWPLALAAYNAGPGRVRRTLTAAQGRTYADIAARLPSETRMYVPKVYATIATRAGAAAVDLPPPRPTG